MQNPTLKLTAALIVVLAFEIPPAASQEATVPEEDLRAASRPPAAERFEGYTWLDANRHVLPFQSDAEIEDFLANASIVKIEAIGTGVTNPQKVLLKANGVRLNAAFKHVDETRKGIVEKTRGRRTFYATWRDFHLYDVAAYHVDRLFRFDRVPPAVPRRIDRTDGSIKIWLEDTITDRERRHRGIEPPDLNRWNQQMQIMHIFDNLVGNRDSNLGNTLIDRNWRIWFFDYSRSFPSSKKLLYPDAITHCERSLWQRLQSVEDAEIRARLEPYLTRAEIEGLIARRAALVAHIRDLIERWGEIHVLFDLEPARQAAQWPSE